MNNEEIKIKISTSYPPNYVYIKSKFNPPASVCFTYGDTVYNPSGNSLSDDLMIHEATHMKQQGDNPKEWWVHYATDPDFRLMEEIEAYRNQYRAFCGSHKDRNVRTRFLMKIAGDLSGPIYGNIINFAKAREVIEK